jgi:hypothetical protein
MWNHVIESQPFQRTDVRVFFQHNLAAFIAGFTETLAGHHFTVIRFSGR